jgi:tRNA A-37 threonylcarbamoyl transferase component Bud32
LSGRAPLLELALGNERLVVRRFSHGGLLRWLTGRRYWDPQRPFRELIMARRLNANGVRVPEVVAACARRSVGAGWKLELVSRRIEGTLDLGTLLSRTARGVLPAEVEQRCARALGRLVARLHELQFLHADLTPRNVLVEADSLHAGEARLWLLDLDGSRFVPGLGAAERSANLARLWRHVAQMQRDGLVADMSGLCRGFLRAYEPRREERRELIRAIARAHKKYAGWHFASRALERGVGVKRAQPRP